MVCKTKCNGRVLDYSSVLLHGYWRLASTSAIYLSCLVCNYKSIYCFYLLIGIIYDVIVEPPSVGSTTDEHGHTRPVKNLFIIQSTKW